MKSLSLSILFFICIHASAQNLSGFYTSNFTGVNAVDFQPADIAGTKYKVDVLIVGAKLSAFNRNILFNNLSSGSTQNQNAVALFLNNNTSKFIATGALYLPSVLYSLNTKTAFAFSTTVNAFAIGQKSESNLLNAFYAYQGNQRSFDGASSTTYINSWSSFNLTGAHVLLDTKRHRLKLGTTLKLAQGAGSAYFSIGNLGYTVDDHAIHNLNADVQYQYNKQLEDLSEGKQVPLFSKSILAADFGVSYEYKNLKSADYATPYLFKFSTSIRNLGKVIKYESADNSFNYNINVSTISVNEFKDVKTSNDLVDTLRSIINATNLQSATYKTKLPSTFMLMADYQVYKNCFVNVNYNYTYVKAGNDANTLLNFSTFNTTVRYDRKHWGVAVPVTVIKDVTGVGVGISARWRYLVVGSANAFNILFNSDGAQLASNAYFVLKVPIYYRDKDKVKKHKHQTAVPAE